MPTTSAGNSDCVYNSVCLSRQDCGRDCIRYAEMKYLLEHSGLPKAQMRRTELEGRQIDLDAYKELQGIKDGILDFVREGRSLYIFSCNTGNGKTTWACKLLKAYFNEIWSGNGFRPRGYFTHLATYLADCKRQIDHPDEDFERLKGIIHDVPLLVLDDVGSGVLSPYEQGIVLELVEHRINSELATIYTANLRDDDLKRSVGTRLKSRMYDLSTVIEFKGTDMRRGGSSTSQRNLLHP